jgi:hypothetical protein
MNEQVFVVSWTGNNCTEDYYEIFKDIENAKLLVKALQNTRDFVENEPSAPTFGHIRMLGQNFYYDFRKYDKNAYMEIKNLNDYFTVVE